MPIEQLQEYHIERVCEIEKQVWGEGAASQEMILSRMKAHPEGSIIFRTDDGAIEGYAASQRVNHLSIGSWNEQTDRGFIEHTHQPNGVIAYGVGMSATQAGAKYGVAGHVIAYYHDFYIQQGRCSLLALGSRVPGFAKAHAKNGIGIKKYVKPASGLSRDPELRLYQKNGFQPLWEIEGYFDDPDSMNYGVMVVGN